MTQTSASPEDREDSAGQSATASDDGAEEPRGRGLGALDGVTGFMGMRWEDPQTVRLQIRPELINAGGLLSGVVTYALVDYCMGSTLWAQTSDAGAHRDDQHLDQLHPDGDRGRDRLHARSWTGATAPAAVMKAAVHAEDGRLLVTAIGSYSIFPRRKRPPVASD